MTFIRRCENQLVILNPVNGKLIANGDSEDDFDHFLLPRVTPVERTKINKLDIFELPMIDVELCNT